MEIRYIEIHDNYTIFAILHTYKFKYSANKHDMVLKKKNRLVFSTLWSFLVIVVFGAGMSHTKMCPHKSRKKNLLGNF